ncbi:hypothetical protein J3R82DRAFT_8460 [Butyriboletus roseoflavus]|nr:hypothetical protein J3R82DRAFT_8460 [Butyriboletus roseoflavus]
MTVTSVGQANSKTAEFARLFDLFDRVATRRTRAITGDTSAVISTDDIANVPAEFAPVLKNLSTVLSLRAMRVEEDARRAQAASTIRARHNAGAPIMTPTTENPMSRVDMVEEDPESPTFPLGERYPFTFKLMLHKLYDLDEWAEKVKNAVETSKSQFKPLAEQVQNIVRDATANMKERAEKRSSVRPVLGALAKLKPPTTTRHPHSPTVPSKSETSRVLKKRCIGRRKSVSDPMSTGVWVYDAAISATEVTGPRPAVEITLSMPRDAGGVVENRARHQSLTALEEIRARDTATRKVKISVPLLQEEVPKSVPPRPSSVSFAEPAQEIIITKNVVKKRSVISTFASEPCKRAAVKRSLCV